MSKSSFASRVAMLLLALASAAYAQTIISFDVGPPPTDTYATVINASGQIAGYYDDYHSGLRGFIRDTDGTITTFAAAEGGTYVKGITSSGEVMGSCYALDGVSHGFLRKGDGTITLFDPPGSSGTKPQAVNPAGDITGFYGLPVLTPPMAFSESATVPLLRLTHQHQIRTLSLMQSTPQNK